MMVKNDFAKESLINLRAHVAYYTGAVAGVVKLFKDVPELRQATGFGCDDIERLDELLRRLHNSFY